MQIIPPVMNYYLNDYWETVSDPRTANFPFVSIGLWKILSIMSSYLIITRIILPSYMKHRKPYSLRKTMFCYNSIMVIANLYLFCQALTFCKWGTIFLDFNYPDQNDRSPFTMHILSTEWIFWMTRFMDLLDTVFFVLRKKDSQITFLHCYHHTIVPILCWLCLKMNPLAPIVVLFGVLNTLIHVIMYLYYALASFGPSIQRYLWWKKYITIIQISQFAICGVYGLILLMFQKGYPMGWFVVAVGQNPLFFYMFYNFYRNSYNKNKNNNLNNNRYNKEVNNKLH